MLYFFSLYCCNFTVLPYHQANLFSVNASLCSKFKGSWRHFFLCTDMFILSWGQIQGKDFQSQAFLLSFTEITFKGIRHPGQTNTKGSTEEKTYTDVGVWGCVVLIEVHYVEQQKGHERLPKHLTKTCPLHPAVGHVNTHTHRRHTWIASFNHSLLPLRSSLSAFNPARPICHSRHLYDACLTLHERNWLCDVTLS